MKRAHSQYLFLAFLMMLSISACNSLVGGDTIINPKSIEVEYPEGMTVTNGSALQMILVNKSLYCLEFPIDSTIPVLVYIQDGSRQVQNKMVYTSPSLKMSPLNTTAARKKFGVSPYIDPKDKAFTLPLYSAFINLVGHTCEDPEITVTKKIPFFIQYFTDY